MMAINTLMIHNYSVFEINIRRKSVNRGWYEIHAVTDTNAFLVIQKQLQQGSWCSCSQIFQVSFQRFYLAYRNQNKPFLIKQDAHV